MCSEEEIAPDDDPDLDEVDGLCVALLGDFAMSLSLPGDLTESLSLPGDLTVSLSLPGDFTASLSLPGDFTVSLSLPLTGSCSPLERVELDALGGTGTGLEGEEGFKGLLGLPLPVSLSFSRSLS